MSTRFFTNHGDQTLLRKFRGIFEHNPDIERFDALVSLVEQFLAACAFALSLRRHKRGENCGARETEINARVARLYGLTPAEIQLVEEAAKK